MKKTLLILLISSAFFAAWLLHEGITHTTPQEIKNSDSRWLTLSGSIRAPLSNLLFDRMMRLQRAGHFREMNQLADWVLTLQPYPESDAFIAWNFAYNVSCTFGDFQERRRWVQRGMEILQDRIQSEMSGQEERCAALAWLWMDKVGGTQDEAHHVYKSTFASERLLPEKRCQELDTLYGKFDWRLPESRALFWASEGLNFSGSKKNESARLLGAALLQSMRAGKVLALSDSETLLLPEPAHAQPLIYHLLWAEQSFGDETFRPFLRTALTDAVILFSNIGDKKEADLYYALLQKREKDFLLPREKFVEKSLSENAARFGWHRVQMLIGSTLIYSQNQFNQGQCVESEKSLSTARRLYGEWMNAVTEVHAEGRLGFPPFSEWKQLIDSISSP